ncbi:hypothetical protein TREMEDRAFT_66422 [Tremella mesenterica DSM 1558]|uniref:uncharacterized protein n=1 Tax=Tremella mesenterica (strain ATCC 24925 / CBS 8224 / DSM 1558 / NBRC 9311 / NRRL Y-6157 / RJB 2259-6 / UBC 559-6) TaxID=578456 RepID=UPI00032C0FFB|nr:uncharacterized protein TREMEDRAFT_66422 [Tremella mesenterica DSM 1558]EIW65592.1 hypothetical protein TREMEDRAFT_66422 [Tremella mesenterica DSM 1558]
MLMDQGSSTGLGSLLYCDMLKELMGEVKGGDTIGFIGIACLYPMVIPGFLTPANPSSNGTPALTCWIPDWRVTTIIFFLGLGRKFDLIQLLNARTVGEATDSRVTLRGERRACQFDRLANI